MPDTPGQYGQRGNGVDDEPEIADLGLRLGARVLDWLIVSIPAVILLSVIFLPLLTSDPSVSVRSNGTIAHSAGSGFVLRYLISAIVLVAALGAYDILMISKQGATYGKQIVGLRVVGENGGPVSTVAAAKRWAVFGVPCIVPYLGFIWFLVVSLSPLFGGRRRQGLPDKAARTMVVRT
jgi:uncharacterized RDD family membrane protein YckC